MHGATIKNVELCLIFHACAAESYANAATGLAVFVYLNIGT